jgi:hypothetical protein
MIMSKNKKRMNSKKKVGTNVARIESLVSRLFHGDCRMPWYKPDNVDELLWEETVEAFTAGCNFALHAVLSAFNGDGGERLQEILNGEVLIIRPADHAEFEAKKEQGLFPNHFRTRKERDDFLRQLADDPRDEEIPSEYLN